MISQCTLWKRLLSSFAQTVLTFLGRAPQWVVCDLLIVCMWQAYSRYTVFTLDTLIGTCVNYNGLVVICEKLRQKCPVLSCDLTELSCRALLTFCKRTLPLLPHVLFLCLCFSPRDLPVFCKWRNGLRLWSRLVVTRGDSFRSAAWMGKASWELAFYVVRLQNSTCLHLSAPHLFVLPLFVIHPYQRPYDIHASNSVESLIQLFSTVSVQYSPAWPKDLVSLLRKVSWTQNLKVRWVGFSCI